MNNFAKSTKESLIIYNGVQFVGLVSAVGACNPSFFALRVRKMIATLKFIKIKRKMFLVAQFKN